MPDTLPTMVPGNWNQPPDVPTGQSVNMMGLRYFEYQAYGLVTDTTGVSIDVKNENDELLTIPCSKDSIALSANDPVYLTHVAFYIPRIGEVQPYYRHKPIVGNVTVSTTNVLKLSVAATDDLTSASVPGAVSGAATSGVLPNGVTAGEAISLWNPLAPLVITSPITLKFFSATLASGGAAGGNIRVSATQKALFIPVRVGYYRKMRSPGLGDFDVSTAIRQIYDALP